MRLKSATAPAARLPTRERVRADGLMWAIGLQGLAAAAAFLGFGAVAQYAFPLLAVGLAALLLRHASGAYLEYALWLWLLTPELRRIIDASTEWHPVSPVMAAAPLVSCLALLAGLRGRRRLRPGGQWLLLLALVAVAYGAVVGALLVGPAPAAAGALNWLGPVALGLYTANAGPSSVVARQVLLRTATLGAIVLGAYAVVQFLFLPTWDEFWMLNAELSSLGRPEPLEVRVFSVLNSPGPFATVMSALLTLLLGTSARGRTSAFALGLVGLGLSLVRGAWLALVLSTVLVVVRTGGRGLLRTAALVTVPVVVLALIGGPVTQSVTERFEATSQAGAQDESLGERLELYRTATLEVLLEPFGNGLGSVGTATKVGNDGRLTAAGNLDSGMIEYLYTFGVFVGGLFLLALLGATATVWRDTRGRDAFQAAVGAALVGLIVQLLFFNVSTSVTGVLVWVLLGFLLRGETADHDPSAHGREARNDALAHSQATEPQRQGDSSGKRGRAPGRARQAPGPVTPAGERTPYRQP